MLVQKFNIILSAIYVTVYAHINVHSISECKYLEKTNEYSYLHI